MDKIVYVFGAGFSAPLGLPVMNNFLIKSKDMYFENPQKYSYFKSIYDLIKEMSIAKSYYDTDLMNIEEIFSIIEMDGQLKGRKIRSQFVDYIKDVIEYHTPAIDEYSEGLPSNWHEFVFGRNKVQSLFGFFVGSLAALSLCKTKTTYIGCQGKPLDYAHYAKKTEYSIITLNYDTVPENFIDYIKNSYKGDDFHIKIAKLHGCIKLGNIVPPTWRKSVNKSIVPAWNSAFDLLVEANHIRFIGYSLPTADAYLKYLMKSAAIKSHHLKSIDVICYDPDGSVKQRYDDFVEFKYYRFKNAKTDDYLNHLFDNYKKRFQIGSDSITLDRLEESHNEFYLTN